MLDVWFILISSWVWSHFFYFFGSRSHIGNPNTIAFWNVEHFQIEALLWIVNYKMEQMCSLWPTNLVWNLGKTYGIELRCCWELFENLMRTWWEHGSTLGIRKKTKNPSPPREHLDPMNACVSLLIGYMKLLFQNCLSTFLTWPIDKGTNYAKDLAWSVLISKDLIQFIYTKLGGQNKTKLSLDITRKNFTALVWDYCFS